MIGTSDEKPLVVFFDCPRKELLSRAIRSARGRNEYWNPYTMVALLTGVLVELALALTLFRAPQLRVPALISLTFAAYPIAMFLPPGVALFLVYRRLWASARRLRADRDVFRLPLRYFTGDRADSPARHPVSDADSVRTWETNLPDGEPYLCVASPVSELINAWSIDQSASFEIPRGVRRSELGDGRTYVFGAGTPEEHRLSVPEDPMAQAVRIPGNPTELAALSARRANLLTLIAGSCITAAIALNLLLVLVVLARLA